MSQPLVMMVAGIGGAVVMLLPIALTKALATQGGYRSWSPGDFLWPSVAFIIATPTGWLYRKFLNNERMKLQAPNSAR
jgi:hypothetical protein